MLQGCVCVEQAGQLPALLCARALFCAPGHPPSIPKPESLGFQMRALHVPMTGGLMGAGGVGGAQAALLGPDAPSVATVSSW